MYPQKTSKYTINYTEDDKKQALINLFVKLLVSRDYPEIITTAEQLAVKYIEQQDEQQS